ncbi:hypothetical protein PGQ11_002508 [Apiospora arundinis]|uniref:Uncharacterized protein n=1 Tax=Apiospora arundinis TaxID=335852 RepID=A0ABR2JIT4_9PEZI
MWSSSSLSPFTTQRKVFSPSHHHHSHGKQLVLASASASTAVAAATPDNQRKQQWPAFYGAPASRHNDDVTAQFSTARVAAVFAPDRNRHHPEPQPRLPPLPHAARSPYMTDRVVAGSSADDTRSAALQPRPRITTALAAPGYAPRTPQAARALKMGERCVDCLLIRDQKRETKRQFRRKRELQLMAMEQQRRVLEEEERQRQKWLEEELKRQQQRQQQRILNGEKKSVSFAPDPVLAVDLETGAPLPYAPWRYDDTDSYDDVETSTRRWHAYRASQVENTDLEPDRQARFRAWLERDWRQRMQKARYMMEERRRRVQRAGGPERDFWRQQRLYADALRSADDAEEEAVGNGNGDEVVMLGMNGVDEDGAM